MSYALTNASKSWRRKDVARIADAFEGSVHVGTDAIVAHASLWALVMIWNIGHKIYQNIRNPVSKISNLRD